MRKTLCIASVGVAVFAIGAGPAAGHAVVVNPPGEGKGTAHHVGSVSHESCFGHLTASQHERSDAVTFFGPPVCPPR